MRIFYAILLATFALNTNAQRFNWATSGGYLGVANSFLGAVDIARDPDGNLYTMDFANLPQECQGQTADNFSLGLTTFIYKFNSQGVLQFINRVGGESGGTFTPLNIETDEEGNLYLLGSINGVSSIIVKDVQVNVLANLPVLIKMDSNGNYVWSQNIIVTFASGICMLQYHNGYIYYQSGNLTVRRISTSGILDDAQLTATYYNSMTSSLGLIFKGSGVFPNGDLLFAAYSSGTVAYGEDTLYHIGNPALSAPLLFLRCDADLNLQWARYVSNVRMPDKNYIPLAIDSDENVYAAVQVNLQLTLGDDVIDNTGGTYTGAIIKMDGAGNGIWARQIASTPATTAWCMLNVPDGTGIMLGGGYNGSAEFGAFALPSAGSSQPFIAKMDYNGNYLNAFSYLGAQVGSDAQCIATDGNGQYYVGGKLPNTNPPVFSCTTITGYQGFYLGNFTEQPDTPPTPEIEANGNMLTATPSFGGNIQWYLNGVMIDNATEPTYEVTESGNYSVQYSYTTGCIGSNTSEVQFIEYIGVENSSIDLLIQVYPNPAGEVVTISRIPNGAAIQLTDLTGKLIFNLKATSSAVQVNTHELINGMYLLQVTNNGQVANKKLIISK